MKQHKNVIIAIGLIFCAFLAYHFYQEQKMNHLHHTYETSLAKALKNSYKDIEEIHFSKPHYSDKPGSWSTEVTLTFTDGTKIEYQATHRLSSTINRSSSVGGKNDKKYSDKLRSKFGKTVKVIKVYYSNEQTEEMK